MAYVSRVMWGQARSVSDASKIVLPSIIDTSLFTLDDVKLAELTNNSLEWKNAIFWVVKTYSDPCYIFSGGQDPHPPGSTP